MLLKELFDRNQVKFPEWLSDEEIDDEWRYAEYYKENEVHKWRLFTDFGYSLISYDKKSYTFESVDNNNELLFIKILDDDNHFLIY